MGKFKLTDSKQDGACPVNLLTKYAKPDAASTPDMIEAVLKHLEILECEIRQLLEKTDITTCSTNVQAYARKHAEGNEIPGTRLYKRHVDDIVRLHMGKFEAEGFNHNPVGVYLLKITLEMKTRWAKGFDEASRQETLSAETAWKQIKIRA